MENTITYEFGWCDFFTPCPHGKDCFVGDYDCCHCKHHVKQLCIDGEINNPIDSTIDYGRYFQTFKGQIICNR